MHRRRRAPIAAEKAAPGRRDVAAAEGRREPRPRRRQGRRAQGRAAEEEGRQAQEARAVRRHRRRRRVRGHEAQGRPGQPNWQSSYTPTPPPAPPTPAPAPAADGRRRGRLLARRGARRRAEAPHPVTTPDDPAEGRDVDEGGATARPTGTDQAPTPQAGTRRRRRRPRGLARRGRSGGLAAGCSSIQASIRSHQSKSHSIRSSRPGRDLLARHLPPAHHDPLVHRQLAPQVARR